MPSLEPGFLEAWVGGLQAHLFPEVLDPLWHTSRWFAHILHEVLQCRVLEAVAGLKLEAQGHSGEQFHALLHCHGHVEIRVSAQSL